MADKKTKETFSEKHIVIDATNATMGRLSSYVAKQSLQGKKVDIVNCNEAIILGNPVSTLKSYQKRVKRKSSTLRGPFFPRTPEKLLKRAIRGMLPDYRVGRGRIAFERIKCYNSVPAELKDSKKISTGKEKVSRKITLKELYQKL